MGWLDFFKKKKEIKKEKINVDFNEAKELIKKELNNQKEASEDTKRELDKLIEKFIFELKEQIKILGLIDLKQKKESERIKEIVLNSLREYINELERFIENLEKINESEMQDYLNKINFAIEFFSKNSDKKLQKASFLIGKEITQVENKIKEFYKEIKDISQKNKVFFLKTNKIKEFYVLEKSLEKIKETKEKCNSLLIELNKEKENHLDKKNQKEKEFRLFKESKEFREWIEKKNKIKEEIDKLNKDINLLKEKIDLKSLLKKFHEIKRVRELINNYRNNFIKGLENDKKLELAEMIDNEKAIELRRIYEKRLNLKSEINLYLENKKEKLFEKELENLNTKINEIGINIKEEKRKLEKFNEKEKNLKKEIILMMENILDIKIN